jgi:hypothetical protein
MAANNIYINYSDLVLTNVNNVNDTITITEITSVKVIRSDRREEHRASGRHFANVAVRTDSTRGLQIAASDLDNVALIDPDKKYNCVVSKYKASPAGNTNSRVYTLAYASLDGDRSPTHPHNKFATVSFTLTAIGGTNDADPLTIT